MLPRDVDGGRVFAPCSVHFINVISNVALQERVRRLQPRPVLAAMRTLMRVEDSGWSRGGLRGTVRLFRWEQQSPTACSAAAGARRRQRPSGARQSRQPWIARHNCPFEQDIAKAVISASRFRLSVRSNPATACQLSQSSEPSHPRSSTRARKTNRNRRRRLWVTMYCVCEGPFSAVFPEGLRLG